MAYDVHYVPNCIINSNDAMNVWRNFTSLMIKRLATIQSVVVQKKMNQKQETKKEKRTSAQNRALHLYLTHVAEALNESGLTVEHVLKNFTMELDWTPEMCKEILWRTAQKRMFGKQSTRDLDKHQEITKVYEAINRFLAKLGVESIPFPSTCTECGMIIPDHAEGCPLKS